jgi:hypothetical protein
LAYYNFGPKVNRFIVMIKKKIKILKFV